MIFVATRRVAATPGADHTASGDGLSREYAEYFASHPPGIDTGTISGRVLLERKIVHVLDVLADPKYTYGFFTFRSLLGVPLLREGRDPAIPRQSSLRAAVQVVAKAKQRERPREPLDLRPAGRTRHTSPIGGAPLRGRRGCHRPTEGRSFPLRSYLYVSIVGSTMTN
jgi:hypothetical protein